MKKLVNIDDVTTRIMTILSADKDLSNIQLAKKIGITPAALQNYQMGRPPQLEQLVKIRNNLNLPFGYLLGEIDVKKYTDDTENTFGLTSECINKLETFNKEQLLCLSKFITLISSDFLDLLLEYSKLPPLYVIDKPCMLVPKNENTNLGEIAEYVINYNNIYKQLENEMKTTIKKTQKPFDNDITIITKSGKAIDARITTKIGNNGIILR